MTMKKINKFFELSQKENTFSSLFAGENYNETPYTIFIINKNNKYLCYMENTGGNKFKTDNLNEFKQYLIKNLDDGITRVTNQKLSKLTCPDCNLDLFDEAELLIVENFIK